MRVNIEWAVVEREVAQTLRRRRMCPDSAAEITQTALERTVIATVPEWSTADAVRWAVRVAINLTIDASRRINAMPVDELPEQQWTGHDVEAVVLGRLEVERVARALDQLPQRDRELLLEQHQAPPIDDRARTRAKVARYRARAKLRTLLDSAGGWLAARPYLQRTGEAFDDTVIGRVVVVAVCAAGAAGQLSPYPTIAPLHVNVAVAHSEPTAPVQPADELDVEVEHAGDGRRQPDVDDEQQPRDRPDWVGRGHGRPVAEVPRPDGRGGGVWWWEDDTEEDDEPIVCVWSRPANTEVCTDATWGDARRASPVPLPAVPT